jgi:hypothetical protein
MSTLGYTGWKKATIALIVILGVGTLASIGFAFGVLIILGLSCAGCLG